MIKSVSYAFATSTVATRFGRASQGCYFIATKRTESQASATAMHGPYATKGEAFAAADTMADHAWSRFTMARDAA